MPKLPPELRALLDQAADDVGRSPARPGGPRSEAGKAAASQNAITHGIMSHTPIVPGENEADWLLHRDGILASLQPVGALESALAERVALLLWRLNRVWRAEAAMIARQMDNRLKFDFNGLIGTPTRPEELSIPMPSEDHVSRYETHISRQLWATLNQLEAMQRRRLGDPQSLARLEVNAPEVHA